MTTEQVVDNAVTWASQGEKILLKNFVFKKIFLTKRNFFLYLPKENQFSKRKNLSNSPGKINVSPKEKILYSYPEKVQTKKNYTLASSIQFSTKENTSYTYPKK